MIKKIALALLGVAGLSPAAFCQIINQDASGQSSIVTQGTAINLNVTQAQIQASHYALFNKNPCLTTGFWGFDLQANNSGGTGNIFGGGKFSPAGSLSLTLGTRSTHFFYQGNTVFVNDQISNSKDQLVAALAHDYRNQVTAVVTRVVLPAGVKMQLEIDLKGLDKQGIANLDASLAGYRTKVTDAGQKAIIADAVTDLRDWVASQQSRFDRLTILTGLVSKIPAKSYTANTTTYWYIRAGSSASQFTYDYGNTIADFSKRFKDTTSLDFHIEAGYTHQWKKNFLGVNLGYERQSNRNALNSADYTYNYQDTTVTSGKLTKQKTFTALSGKYGFYNKVYLNVDWQHLFDVATEKYLSAGPYIRYNDPFNADGLAKTNLVLGASVNYLDGKAGKFLGGIFLQSNDITGKTQQQFTKSLQFGLVAKFSLSTIFLGQVAN